MQQADALDDVGAGAEAHFGAARPALLGLGARVAARAPASGAAAAIDAKLRGRLMSARERREGAEAEEGGGGGGRAAGGSGRPAGSWPLHRGPRMAAAGQAARGGTAAAAESSDSDSDGGGKAGALAGRGPAKPPLGLAQRAEWLVAPPPVSALSKNDRKKLRKQQKKREAAAAAGGGGGGGTS